MKTIKQNEDVENKVDVKGSMGALAEVAAESKRSRRAAGGAVAEIAAGWLAPQYVLALREDLAGQPDTEKRAKLLHRAVADVVALQRGSVWADWLALERERLEFLKKKHQANLKVARDGGRVTRGKAGKPQAMTAEEECRAIADKVDEVMGLKPRKKPEARIQEPGFNGELSTEGNEGGEGGELHG